MRARPAWLALGAIVASGTAGYEPMGGDSAVAVIAAVAVSVALAAAACLCRSRQRRGLGAALVVASLGAAMVAARLAIGLSVGGGAGAVETTALPDGSGPWNAGVESAHTTNGLQIATIYLTDRPVRCSAQFPVYPRLIAGDIVMWSGRVRPLTDGEYDRYLAAQGISATCEATDLTLVSHDDSAAGPPRGDPSGFGRRPPEGPARAGGRPGDRDPDRPAGSRRPWAWRPISRRPESAT